MPRRPKGEESKKCAGTSKDGSACQRWAQRGKEYCYQCDRRLGITHKVQHDRQFKPGPANPSYKTGAYAKVIPKRLYTAYRQALMDPDLLVQREEIALKRARLAEILSTVDTGESDKTWARLLDAKYRFNLHSQLGTKPDQVKMKIALDEIMALIDEGNESRLRWDDAHKEVMALDKLKSSERKRISEMKAFVTIDQAIGMLATISYHLKEAVDQNITDKKEGDKVINAVAKQVKRLLTMGEMLAKKEAEKEVNAD